MPDYTDYDYTPIEYDIPPSDKRIEELKTMTINGLLKEAREYLKKVDGAYGIAGVLNEKIKKYADAKNRKIHKLNEKLTNVIKQNNILIDKLRRIEIELYK